MKLSHADRDRHHRLPTDIARIPVFAAVLAFGFVHAQDTPTPPEPTTEPSEVPDVPEHVDPSEAPETSGGDADDSAPPSSPGATSNREDGTPKGPGTRDAPSPSDATPKGPGKPSQSAPERQETQH